MRAIVEPLVSAEALVFVNQDTSTRETTVTNAVSSLTAQVPVIFDALLRRTSHHEDSNTAGITSSRNGTD